MRLGNVGFPTEALEKNQWRRFFSCGFGQPRFPGRVTSYPKFEASGRRPARPASTTSKGERTTMRRGLHSASCLKGKDELEGPKSRSTLRGVPLRVLRLVRSGGGIGTPDLRVMRTDPGLGVSHCSRDVAELRGPTVGAFRCVLSRIPHSSPHNGGRGVPPPPPTLTVLPAQRI